MSDQARKFSLVLPPTAVTAVRDLFEITPAASSPVTIVGWEFSQTSDYGDAQAEGASVSLNYGYTTTGNGTIAIPRPMWTGNAAAAAVVRTMSTTVATGGTIVTRATYPFNWQIGHQLWLPDGWGIRIAPSTRTVLRMNDVPNDSITISGTVYFYES